MTLPHSIQLLLFGILSAQRLWELRYAERNRAFAIEQGGIEFGARHYPLFFILHTGWLCGWMLEAWQADTLHPWWLLWSVLLLSAEVLRYIAIRTLGKQWNTRIIIIPGSPRITHGIYRWISHPNYWAVCLELCALPMMVSAWKTALIASLANALLLLLIRIPAENAALRLLSDDQPQKSGTSVIPTRE
jgi:methyltransferase